MVEHRGHLRLYLVASVLWLAVVGPLTWRPLPYVQDAVPISLSGEATAPDVAAVDLSDRRMRECNATDELEGRYADYDACAKRVKETAQREVDQVRMYIVLRWVGLLLTPALLPAAIFVACIIMAWVREGYRNPA